MNEKTINQILKFIIVGGLATFLDFSIFYVSCNFLYIYPLISNIISFSISVIFNYFASVKWVFDVNNQKNKRQLFIEFFLFSFLGLLLTEIIIYIGIETIRLNKMTIKIIATLIVMVFNFVTRKFFLEK